MVRRVSAALGREVDRVVATIPSRTLFLSALEFEALIDEHPGHLRHFSRLLAYRLAVALRFLAESHGLRPEDWLLQVQPF